MQAHKSRLSTGILCANLVFWLVVASAGPPAMAGAADPGDALSGSPAWRDTLQFVWEAYPKIPRMTTGELSARLSGGNADNILLLDARSRAEFDVSHLRSAAYAGNAFSALKAIMAHEAQPDNATIVVYCSVGYRSARLAKRLRQLGITDVYNLEGSLFQWANEGRPLYRGEVRVHAAHPYDEEWGRLLDRRYWPD